MLEVNSSVHVPCVTDDVTAQSREPLSAATLVLLTSGSANGRDARGAVETRLRRAGAHAHRMLTASRDYVQL